MHQSLPPTTGCDAGARPSISQVGAALGIARRGQNVVYPANQFHKAPERVRRFVRRHLLSPFQAHGFVDPPKLVEHPPTSSRRFVFSSVFVVLNLLIGRGKSVVSSYAKRGERLRVEGRDYALGFSLKESS